jgi:hypothetical protein
LSPDPDVSGQFGTRIPRNTLSHGVQAVGHASPSQAKNPKRLLVLEPRCRVTGSRDGAGPSFLAIKNEGDPASYIDPLAVR